MAQHRPGDLAQCAPLAQAVAELRVQDRAKQHHHDERNAEQLGQRLHGARQRRRNDAKRRDLGGLCEPGKEDANERKKIPAPPRRAQFRQPNHAHLHARVRCRFARDLGDDWVRKEGGGVVSRRL